MAATKKPKIAKVPKTKRLTRSQINKISDYKYKLVNYIEELEAKTGDSNEVKKLKTMRKEIRYRYLLYYGHHYRQNL